MFVKTAKVRRDNRTYEYLSLAEAYRDDSGKTRHRTVVRLGEASRLRDSGELDRIVAALMRHADPSGNEGGRVSVSDLESETAPALGAVAAVEAWWNRLGLGDLFEGDTGDAVFAMVANRLVARSSKRRVPEWAAEDVAMPAWFDVPPLHRYYRAVDAVAESKDATEEHLYQRLTDLANLDLSLVCYDLTSTFFEGSVAASDRFPSKAFGYSRDHRRDRPQVMIGLLCTSDGIPIAHHVFAGNTSDGSTLPSVLDDLKARFSVGKICVVADRGLVSADNLTALADSLTSAGVRVTAGPVVGTVREPGDPDRPDRGRSPPRRDSPWASSTGSRRARTTASTRPRTRSPTTRPRSTTADLLRRPPRGHCGHSGSRRRTGWCKAPEDRERPRPRT